MANSYEYLSISLLFSLCVSGGFGSESNYSCDLQLLTMWSTIPLGDKHEGKLTDCTEIGWIESQKQFGLKSGESAECSKALSSKCQKKEQLTPSNDKIEFNKTIGNDAMGLKVNCTIDLDAAFKKPINLWQCGDDVIHRSYILTSASAPERTISKRDITALNNKCIEEKAMSCMAPMADQMEKPGIIAVNKEKLIEMCNNVVKPAMRCMSGALRECSKSSGVNFEQMFSGITSTYNDLCDFNSQFSKDYLKHAPCMSKVDKLSLFTCAKVKATNLFSSSHISDHTEILCCSMKIALTCIKEIVNEHCGAEASQFRYQMEKTIMASMIQETCIDSYGNIKCSHYNSQFPTLALTSLVPRVSSSSYPSYPTFKPHGPSSWYLDVITTSKPQDTSSSYVDVSTASKQHGPSSSYLDASTTIPYEMTTTSKPHSPQHKQLGGGTHSAVLNYVEAPGQSRFQGILKKYYKISIFSKFTLEKLQ